ncbi:MAG: hypothetical protein JO147_14055 [Actinobacteria bacterium]|nr:hypothetical protein [Actinomycetota bacterium]
MASTTSTDSGVPGRKAPERSRRFVEWAAYAIGAGLIVSGLVHLVVYAIDGGPWYGPVSWRKPVTFGVSFGAVLIAVTWVSSYLVIGERLRAWLIGIFALDCVLEVAGITVQAWRHVPSHFNTESPFDTAVAMNLAVGGGVLVVILGVFAVTALRGRIEASPSMHVALRAGFGLMIIGLVTGAAMIAHAEVLVRTGHLQQAYHDAGSVKWLHVLALLAIVALPAAAWLLGPAGRIRRGWRSEADRTRLVGRAAVGYAGLMVLALVVSLL